MACAIGHTRWATHGAPTDANAHPHVVGDVALVHNGIIDNAARLRAELDEPLASETDSEVVAHLLAREVRAGRTLVEAMRATVARLDGAFALVAVHAAEPDRLVVARRNSPLVIGRGEGEWFVASDVAAFLEHTRDVRELGQDQVAELTAETCTVTGPDGAPAQPRPITVDWDLAQAEKQGHDWFMRKEIVEQPTAIADTLRGHRGADGELVLDETRVDADVLRRADKVVVVACGSAHYAGHLAKHAIEHWVRIPCEVELASEFRYRDPIVDDRTLVVAISQSGETADTLMAMRHGREQGATVVAICNTAGATIAREADAVLYTHAGPEIGVASTKGFTTQLVASLLLALHLARLRDAVTADEARRVLAELDRLPGHVEAVLARADEVAALARRLQGQGSMLFLGRHVGHLVALEGALKLKELAYLHAEGFAAGELKHGPIALVADQVPVFVVVPPPDLGPLRDKVLANIAEVRARGAHVVALADDDWAVREAAHQVIALPAVPALLQPVVAIVPLQLLACEVATRLGHDVDQPRNLAKSVTVE